jgi:hypothetical protein
VVFSALVAACGGAEKTSLRHDAADASIDGAVALCSTQVAPSSGTDAGPCLAIYYATVERLTLWIDDATAPGGGSRVALGFEQSQRVGAHTYGYSGNSLITSGSAVDIHLDVDSQPNAMDLSLGGECAPQVAPYEWDHWTSLTRTTCLGCPPTSSRRRYDVVRSEGDGGLVYTFTADEPPRTCGAGVDLLSFTTWPD